jgi:hypothetical protein
MAVNSEAILNQKYFEMIKLLNLYLNHFPRHEKYALSNNIRNTAYEVYDLITECQKRYFKKNTITQLDVTHEKLRMQIYLANELGYFYLKDGKNDKKIDGMHRYLAISNLINEIGKIIGSWMKKLRDMGNLK